MAVPPEALPITVAGALNLGLAALLLYLNFYHTANRAFALVLIGRGLGHAEGAIVALAGEPASGTLVLRLLAYPSVVLPLILLFFLAVYPRPRRGLPRPPWTSAPFLGAMGAVALLYALDHTLFFGPEGPGGGGQGPLALVNFTYEVVFGLAALLFARDALREPPGPLRQSALLVSLGFALVGWYDNLAGVARAVLDGAPWPPETPIWAAALVLLAASLALLARRGLRDPDEPTRRRVRLSLLAVVFPIASAAVVVALGQGPPLRGGVDVDLAGSLGTIFAGVWRLPFPILITYALLKHQLFDIDLKLKWTIRQSTVAAVFIGLFFIVSEGAQVVFSESAGPMLGIAAAGMLVFAMAPLQRVAERVATAAVPGARGLGELSHPERLAFYQEQCRLAWADGLLSPNERRMLDDARERLGLSLEEATRLEREVTPA